MVSQSISLEHDVNWPSSLIIPYLLLILGCVLPMDIGSLLSMVQKPPKQSKRHSPIIKINHIQNMKISGYPECDTFLGLTNLTHLHYSCSHTCGRSSTPWTRFSHLWKRMASLKTLFVYYSSLPHNEVPKVIQMGCTNVPTHEQHSQSILGHRIS